MVKANGQKVTFEIECRDAVKVFLVGDFASGAAQVFGMEQVRPALWRTQMDLPPGEYRFCYYLYDGRLIRYQPPDERRIDGLKAVLTVDEAA